VPLAWSRAGDRLVFRKDDYDRVRSILGTHAPLESACFLLARPVRTTSGRWRLIVFEILEPDSSDVHGRSAISISISPRFVAHVMDRAKSESASVVLVHSHPEGCAGTPSSIDLATEQALVPRLRRWVPDAPVARLIVDGEGDVHAAIVHGGPGDSELMVVSVGEKIDVLSDTHDEDVVDRHAQYDRQMLAFGEIGQRRLRSLIVGVVGVGGTGSLVAQQLAHLGVRQIIFVDPDAVERSNLNRLVGATPQDVGRTKVDVCADAYARVSPNAVMHAVRGDVRDRSSARLLLDADVLFLCTDSQGSRAVVSQISYQYAIPTFDLGVGIHMSGSGVRHVAGRVQMIGPGLPCLLCCGVMDPSIVRQELLSEEERRSDPYVAGVRVPQPAVISINSAVAGFAVTMFLAAATGIPMSARHCRLRMESGTALSLVADRVPGCPVCSESGALGRGDDWDLMGRGTS